MWPMRLVGCGYSADVAGGVRVEAVAVAPPWVPWAVVRWWVRRRVARAARAWPGWVRPASLPLALVERTPAGAGAVLWRFTWDRWVTGRARLGL